MKKLCLLRILIGVVLTSCGHRIAAQECSTEKVNDDCTVTIDRSYPVGLPTIQMRPGKKVTVKVLNGLPFEILSLDLQTGQAVPGTEQAAAFLTAALPNLKGLLVQQQLKGVANLEAQLPVGPAQVYLSQINELQQKLNGYFHLMDTFDRNATIVYDQLNEVLGTIPPEVLPQGQRCRLQSSKVGCDVPRPWIADGYQEWIDWMSCEIAGKGCPPASAPPPGVGPCVVVGTKPPVRALLACGSSLVTDLGPCPTTPDDKLVACTIAALQHNIDITSDDIKNYLSGPMGSLNESLAALNADAAAVTAINKDLSAYFVNISESSVVKSPGLLGAIFDPYDGKNQRNVQLRKFLGRQVTFAVNAVNQVATPATSVTAATQKKAIVTITVLYADPIFEVSAGGIFSTLANRSFANQTIVTQNPGASPTQGNVVITQSITRPTVVLFAGANWRLGHDSLWPDGRRRAYYFTTTVGVNVNNTAAEFGVGPSVSWRSLMFSALYDWGHDVRLTQGEHIGMIWCNQTGPSSDGTIPKCSGPPPSPSTEKYWRGTFAFGISVRVPTIFGGGGSSAAPSSAGH